ncbi:hypothetical protein NUH86_08610 [Sphingobium sp. JS3065]|nr:hypothetical protein [Sphingobium sp. JS3065]UZW53631.1 hypothetical protein NUH86_08610 [Sphingobium sp. JS3065]
MRLSDDARPCANGHGTSLSGMIAAIMQAFCTLHRIAWSAPWTEERR